MGRYENASSRTELAIQEAYWELYESGAGRITIEDVCRLAGIHRSTFYYHYSNVDSILESIKDKQMRLLQDLFESTGGYDVDFESFIPGFQDLFDSNERYLVPLVLEYGDREFSLRYRSYLEDRMFEHLRLTYDSKDSRTAAVIETIVAGMVNMFLISLSTHTLTLEDSNMLSHGMINVGLRSVLRDHFGIHIGFTSMMPLERSV